MIIIQTVAKNEVLPLFLHHKILQSEGKVKIDQNIKYQV